MANPIQIFEYEDIPETDITHVRFKVKKIVTDDVISQMGAELFSLADQGKKKLLVDWGNVEYFSSAGLGKFITLQRLVNDAGGKLVFCAINEDVFEVFEVTRLNKLFNCDSQNLIGGLAVFN